MGEKDEVKQEANEKETIDADEAKKVDEDPIDVVFKLDLHCEGCAKRVKKWVSYIEGVKSVKADSTNNKLKITGKVNPEHIKERVEFKTRKKVEILSPKPEKDDKGDQKPDDKPVEAKANDQKPKEPQLTTVVLKISLHCDGCMQKIKRIISKIDGVDSVNPDGNKNLVTVKGTMNTKELIPYLKDKLKRNVDIVPPTKEEIKDNDKKDENIKVEEGGVAKKEKEGNNNGDNKKIDAKKVVGNSEDGEKKKNDEEKATIDASNENKPLDDKTKTTGGGGDGDGSKNVAATNKFDYYRNNPYTYTYTMPVYNQSYHNHDYGVPAFSSLGYGYDQGYVSHGYVMPYPHGPTPPPPMSLHNPRVLETDMFSAENPNACSIV